ncbi:alpha/beta hydrolase [bacterium]|nr:MAG: alpha/beta hydrolase [bacterium]
MTKYTLLLLCAALCLSCSLDDLIIYPDKSDSYNFSTYIIPENQRQLVTFESGGNTLYGAFIKTRYANDNPRFTILYCHGRERDMTGYWFEVELHYLAGFDVLTYDYRGFGMSEGKATLDGLYEDAAAALAFMIDSLHVHPDSIVYHGVSLGTGMAAYLASEVHSPYRIVLETPYANAEGWADVIMPLNLPPSFVIDGNFNNLPFVRNFTAPLLIIHGGRDQVLPFEHHGQVVYNAAPEPKELVYLPEAGHTDILVHTGDAGYQYLMRNFIFAAR